MLLFRRFLRRSALCLLCMMPGFCAAQQTGQFLNVPQVQLTGGRVTSLVAGILQSPPSRQDLLYINAPVGSGANSSLTAGVLLSGQGAQGFTRLGEDEIPFSGVSNAVAAIGDFNADGINDFAFGLTPSGADTTNFCIYFGTGGNVASGKSSFNGAGHYPAQGNSGCMTLAPLPLPSQGGTPTQIGYIAAFPFKTGQAPQLIVEDPANDYLYILSVTNAAGSGGVLLGVTITAKIQLPAADGAGPIYVGDFDGDGNTDFIVNGQAGASATVYLGDGNGGVKSTPVRYTFNGIRSMLVRDMDGDGKPDMVVENSAGGIEIHKGVGDGTFAANSEGGTTAASGSLSGNGGRLAAINPNTGDILTTTPIGMSLLQGNGSLNYTLKAIYNIGPGRSSFALGDFYGTNTVDFAVDSPEGVATIPGNADGTFQTSNAYSALAPALGAVFGKFRNAAANKDVVVATGATQAQLLEGNGDGTFTPFPALVDSGNGPGNVPAGVWSNILAGDFDGDGKLDVLYSLTGLPQLPPNGPSPVLYIQYGIGDGTFDPSGNAMLVGTEAANPNGIFVESAVGDFNGDGVSDVATSDAYFDAMVLGGLRNGFGAGFLESDNSNTDFSQVAAGFFMTGRANQQDLIFQQGASFIPYKNAQDKSGKNFTPELALIGPGAPQYPATLLLADVDGDGNGDVVAVYYNTAANPVGAGTQSPYQVWIWWGIGDGTFNQTPLVLNLSRNYYLGAVADMNGDGRPDLILSDGSLVSILYNQGGRSFGTVQANGLYSSEQHFLAGQGINSITLGDVNGDGVPDVVLANGGLTLSNPIAIGGRTQSSISLTPNPADINTGGITVLLNHLTTKPVTATLTALPEPSAVGAAFAMTATITPSAGTAVPTGFVTFYLDGFVVGNPVAVMPGAATSTAVYNVPAGNTYAAGPHAMSAIYSGDSANSPFTFSGTHQIQSNTTPVATTTTLYLCIGPSASCPSIGTVTPPAPPYPTLLGMFWGQSFNGVAGATANDNSALSPTSVIDFNDTYNGTTTTECVLAIGPPLVGCPPSVGTTIGTKVGTHVFTAAYQGDATHAPSTSPAVTINVAPDTTTAMLMGSPNPSPAGQPVTFTATVTGNFAAPTGPIAFFYGNTPLGQVNLVPDSGTTSTATVTTSALPLGSDVITATYGATQNFNAANASFTETITPSLAGNFTISVTPASSSVGVGYGAQLAVTVTAQNGFSQDVNLSCSNLPSEAACIFASSTIAGGAGSTNLIVSTTAPHSCGTTQPYFLGSNGGGRGLIPFGLPATAGLLALFVPGKRRWLRALIAIMVAVGATQVTGCGNCTDLGTRPATYTFTVTGTASGSSEVQAQPVTITVTI